MIPLRDVVPTRTTPIVTLTLVAAQAAAGTGLPLAPALVHVSANAVCLWIFGTTVEDRMGHGRFAVFYAMCAVAAAAMQVATDGRLPLTLIAASGGVAGLTGAYFVLYPASKVVGLLPLPLSLRFVELPAVFLPCVWFLLQFASGNGTVAVTALAVGAATVRLFRRSERMRVEWWNER